jgi:hypothetical protein
MMAREAGGCDFETRAVAHNTVSGTLLFRVAPSDAGRPVAADVTKGAWHPWRRAILS